MKTPSYYRGRAKAIDYFIQLSKDEFERTHLQSGFVPKHLQKQVEEYAQKESKTLSNEALDFVEITSYSTWFAMHPEKMAGVEHAENSIYFPVRVKGTKSDVLAMIDKALKPSNEAKNKNAEKPTNKGNEPSNEAEELELFEMEAEALALALALELELKSKETMNYVSSLNGIDGIGSLNRKTADYLKANNKAVEQVLKKAETLNGLGKLNTTESKLLTAEEVIEQHNAGITADEIKAWVWYRRSIGIPMYGWEKYYIDSQTSGENENMLTTNKDTVVKNTAWVDIGVVPKNTLLGKRVGNKEHQSNDLHHYIFYRDSEGIKIVRKNDVNIKKSTTKTDPKELDKLVKKGVLFYLNGELLPYPVYLFANIYDRELQLREDKNDIIKRYGEDIYKQQAELIKNNKPLQLSVINPDVKERPQISCISDYAKNFKISALREELDIHFPSPQSLFVAFENYLKKLDSIHFEKTTAYSIIFYYLHKRRMEKGTSEELKQEILATTRNEGEELFRKFLHEALLFEDQQKLDMDWNRRYNAVPYIAHHKIPIGFTMSRKFKGFDLEIRPAQREGIAFMELVGSGIIAYDVGVGKTITAIIEVANAIHSGKCKRPIIVVPNSTYKNWFAELIGTGEGEEGVLTGTGVKVNNWFNLSAKILKGIDINKAVPENSITLLTYEGFNKIGFSDQASSAFIDELKKILNQENEGMSERQKAQANQKKWEFIGVGNAGTIADIDKLGFDYVVIDEAHNFKKVFSDVKNDKYGNKRFGINDGDYARRAVKAFFINNYIQRKFGRNVMLLTATPFTNSPLEVYSMLMHVAYHGLQEMGYFSIQDFFEQFILETTEEVVDVDEKIKTKNVVKSFNNRLILQKLIYNHINYKTGEEAGVKRPCKINLPKTSVKKEDGTIKKLLPSEQILTYLPMTKRQRENQNEIIEAINIARNMNYSAKGANIFRAMHKSLNNAISPFLYEGIFDVNYEELVNESPKIKYTCEAIRSVKKWHEDRGEACSGQVIFSNRGKDIFPFIKEYLVQNVGFKPNEVDIVVGGATENKERSIQRFNEGTTKVLIGTATIREGVNLQKRSTCLYNLYPDYSPTHIQQLEGRIWRQGNKFGYVRIVLPLVQDSMDVFVFQKIEEKTSRINDIWYKAERGNVLDVESLDPEEVKYALITNIDIIANNIIEKDLEKQQRTIQLIDYNIENLKKYKQFLSDLNTSRENLRKEVLNCIRNMETFDYIIKPPSKEELAKKYDKFNANEVANQIKKYEELKKLMSETPLSDKTLLKSGRICHHLFPHTVSSFEVDKFAERLSKTTKIEKNLEKQGYTPDKVDKAMEDLKKNLDKANAELERLKSEEYKEEVRKEVKEKKSAMKMDNNSTVESRVKEFSNLNYLLSYQFKDVENNTCELPNKGKAPSKEASKAPSQEAEELELLEMEAEALALELELKLEL